MKIKSDFPTDALGLCYDAGHANLCAKGYLHEGEKSIHRAVWQILFGKEPDWDDKICEKMQSQIVTCHLHDNDGSKDQHKLPGEGNVDWKHIADLLRNAPRLKCIQSEVSCLRNKVTIPQLCSKFRELFPDDK